MVSAASTFFARKMNKRSLLAATAGTLAALILSACSPNNNAASAAESKSDTASTVAASAAEGAGTAHAGVLKIGFMYVGPVGDGSWTFGHDNARKAVEAEFGDKVQTTFVESIPEGPDAERVARDMASQGNQLVFATSFGFMDPVLKAAKDFSDVKFEHATGYKTVDNFSAYDSRTFEGAYMAGVLAGKMTQSNVLGYVASMPIPEVIRNINSFTLGAQSVNPNISTKVVWVNAWFDPSKETEAATALINGGADVLIQNTNSSAVLQTAEKMGKRAMGWNSDMSRYAPKAHVASAIIDWSPYYIKTVRDVLDGKWQAGKSWWGVKEGAIDLVSIADDVPQDAKDQVEAVKASLKDGSHIIWKGPIVDQSGKEVLAQGVVADEEFLKNITFYVKGVEGNVPGAN